MKRINLIEGETKARDAKGRPVCQIHPRVAVYGDEAHITTPLLKAGEGQYGPIRSWASIAVRRGWGPDNYRVRKVRFWSLPVEN